MTGWCDVRERQVGLAYNLLIFVASIIIAAMLFAVLNGPQADLLSAAEAQTSTQASARGLGVIEQAWSALPIVVFLLGGIQFIAGAVRESRAP